MPDQNKENKLVIEMAKSGARFEWKEIIKSIYYNLGSRASNIIVHFTIDIKAGYEYLGKKTADYENGLISDLALEVELFSNYPIDDHEYLNELVFMRSFLLNTTDQEEISTWVYNHFGVYPDYVWVDGKMVGGIYYPQKIGDEWIAPLMEDLPDSVCCLK